MGLILHAGDDLVEDPGPGPARETGEAGVGRGVAGLVRGGFEVVSGAAQGSEYDDGGHGEKAES